MNKAYLIQLQPLGSFYFGSERNFLGGESYFARSLLFPQQTTLLGALRYKLLEAHGILTSGNRGRALTDEKAAHLIGPTGFSATRCCDPADYGVIKGLSHLFLMKGEEIFNFGNKDDGLALFMDRDKACSLTDRWRDAAPLVRNYNPKHPPEQFLVSESGSRHLCKEVSCEATDVGIYKTKARFRNRSITDEEEKGFYKQVSQRFKDQAWRFCFLACMDEDAAKTLIEFAGNRGRTTPVGGERSPFNFTVKEIDNGLTNRVLRSGYSTTTGKDQFKAVLLSDAFVDGAVYEACDFAVADTVDFRFLKTSVHKTKNYFRLSDKDEFAVGKSGKYNLVERGSVFFIRGGMEGEFKAKMRLPAAFRQIGYNSFVLINSSCEADSWIMER